MDRSSKIALMEVIILCGCIASVSYHYVAGIVMHWDFPFFTFLHRPENQFYDFIEPVANIDQGHMPYPSGPAYSSGPPYPPMLLALVIALFRHNSIPVNFSLFLFLITFIYVYMRICYNYLRSESLPQSIRTCLIFSFCTYSFLYALDRANFEVWSVLATAAAFGGFGAYGDFNKVKPWLATISMAITLSFKPFAIFFLPAYAAQRTKREVCITLLLAAVFTICGLVALGPNMLATVHNLVHNMGALDKKFVIGTESMVNGSGIFMFLKLLSRWYYGNYSPHWVVPFEFGYSIFAGIATICLFLYVWLVERDKWRQFTICALAINLLPTIAFPYRLLYVNLAMMAFANVNVKQKNDWLYCTLFALVVMPMGYFFFSPREVSETTLIEPLSMVALAVMIVRDGFGARRMAQLANTTLGAEQCKLKHQGTAAAYSERGV